MWNCVAMARRVTYHRLCTLLSKYKKAHKSFDVVNEYYYFREGRKSDTPCDGN